MPVAAPRRCAHGDEDGVGPVNGSGQIRGKRQPPGAHVLGHQVIEARFVDRYLAIISAGQFLAGFVDTNNLVPEVRETDSGDEADVACSDHCDAHGTSCRVGQVERWMRHDCQAVNANGACSRRDMMPGRFFLETAPEEGCGRIGRILRHGS